MKKRKKDIYIADNRLSSKKPHDSNNSISNLFTEEIANSKATRRSFLKMFGYSFALAGLASCQTKVRKAIPYVINPKEIVPGKANYYASSYINGSDYCSIIVKTREGRPIKIEGNPESNISNGGTSARTQASILELYDTNRFKAPMIGGVETTWDDIDKEITDQLMKLRSFEDKVVLITPTISSPSTIKTIQNFTKRYKNIKWIQYDAVPVSSIIKANKLCFDYNYIPDYRFDKASVIVSFGADFLGSWLNPVEFTHRYSQTRKLSESKKSMSHHIQFESNYTITGGSADKRYQIKPSEEKAILINILADIRSLKNLETVDKVKCNIDTKKIAILLNNKKKKSLVVSSSTDTDNQLLVNAINFELESFHNTINFDRPLLTKQSNSEDFESIIDNTNIKGAIFCNVNPVYNYYDSKKVVDFIKKLHLSVAISASPNETTEIVKYICPDNHYLESWNDIEARHNMFSLSQPVIEKIFNTRQLQDSFLKWSYSNVSFYDFMQENWTSNYFPKQTKYSSKTDFFDKTVQRGVFEISPDIIIPKTEISDIYTIVINNISLNIKESDKPEYILYESIAMGEGNNCSNPWLQELPDPVTKICWDNYAMISPDFSKKLGVKTGQLIKINEFKIPVIIIPGTAENTFSIALGYGRKHKEKSLNKIGVNAYTLADYSNGDMQFNGFVEKVEVLDKDYPLATTQSHHSMEGRAIIRESNFDKYKKNESAGNEIRKKHKKLETAIYRKIEYKGHHWGMAIDLNACTGCSNCVISCQAENNIPVVGKEEVGLSREMHWIRVDRYFSDDNDNPSMSFQPVMCQHCDNAPCENVCPVAATTHSSEGLNQMTYNRCVGTKYCGNNCPYKVRRFNWFNYSDAGTIKGNIQDVAHMMTDLKRLVLNPDVTVRAQGVIEKCSMCVQRIQDGKLQAKLEGRKLKDDDIKTACSQSCPSQAIVFGDMNDPESKISKLLKSKRNYQLLEELYTNPSVNYLTKIRNKKS